MGGVFKHKEIMVGEFKLLEKFNGGSFGDIYHGESFITGQQVAIKLESVYNKCPRLKFEYDVYRLIKGAVGVPKVYHFTKLQKDYALVMDLLGHSLEHYFNKCYRKFTMKTILMLGEQMVSRVQTLHDHGIVHRDIKPENFLMGINGGFRTVYLIDIGLGKKFYNRQTKVHIPYREGRSLTGTIRYCSISANSGIEQSRRDDLVSIGYVLIYFHRGRLPWQGIQGTSRKQRSEMICEKKISTSVSELCKDAPFYLHQYLSYCLALGFEQCPNYDLLRKYLLGAMNTLGYKHDLMFDWMCIRFKADCQKKNSPKEITRESADDEDCKKKCYQNLESLLL